MIESRQIGLRCFLMPSFIGTPFNRFYPVPLTRPNRTGPFMSSHTRTSDTPASPLRSAGVGKQEDEKPCAIRSLFVSDVHLGCKHSQANEFLKLLERFEPENLYIVGDFIDGWKLKRHWRWLPVYDQIIQRLMTLKSSGTQLKYMPGNHDSFLRGYLANYGVIEVQDRFVHEAGDGRRYVVLHGDQFDHVEQKAQWLSLTASYFYDLMLSANWLGNKLRGKKHQPYALCGVLKRRVKAMVTRVSSFEKQVAQDAIDTGCDGIICGHIHTPRIDQIGDIQYLNTGDWVENCSALIEQADGSFDLIRYDGKVISQLTAQATPLKKRPVGQPTDESVTERVAASAS